MDMTDWARSKLKNLNPTGDPDPLKATFQLASLLASESGLAGRINEEAMTGALLGAMTSAFPWCVAAFGGIGESSCSWIGYRKGGRRPDSESRTGTDFGLVIRLPAGRMRLAIFQAKKFRTKKSPYLEVHQRIPAYKKEEASFQLVNLVNHAYSVLTNAELRTGKGFRSLDFVHYAGYSEDGIYCLPLSLLRSQHSLYGSDSAPTTIKVHRNKHKFIPMIDILDDGCLAASRQSKHWLELDDQTAQEALPPLLEVMDIYFGESTSDGLVPYIFPSVRPIVRVVVKRQKAKPAQKTPARNVGRSPR